MGQWINFKELREQVDFETVFRFYGIELKTKKQDQHQGFCPLPSHKGKGKSPSFSVSIEKGVFKCFGCGASGNVLDFVCRMEGLSPSNPQEVRRAALLIQERHLSPVEPTKKAEPKVKKQEKRTEKPVAAQKQSTSVVVNAPLDFTLKGLDTEHPYFAQRGIEKETVDQFGLGFCSRGLMQGRIVIPLHDTDGKLVGYAGRVVDDDAIGESNPKYRFPGERMHNNVRFEFRKSLLLYNHHRIEGPVDDLIVVEGFASVWLLTQKGYKNIVAVMGASCSDEQAELIVELVKPDGRVWIMPDGDAAGERCAADILARVSPCRFCRWVKLDDGRQPTDSDDLELAGFLNLGKASHA